MSQKTIHSVGVIMNGVTGRMGLNQHLRRSLYAIMQQGGVALSDSEAIMPRPLLVGRSASKLEAISTRVRRPAVDHRTSTRPWPIPTTPFTSTPRPPTAAPRPCGEAIAAGKHIYCEKPVSGSVETALELYRLAKRAGVKHGVVQDKLWLPGLLKLQTLRDLGFFGRILSVRGEFGYWVFEGDTVPAQRPSWNYRKEDGGGIILDMLCHWRYVLDNLFGAGEGGLVPGRYPHPVARGTKRDSPTNARPTIRLMRPSSWKAASSPISTRRGACGCGATIC